MNPSRSLRSTLTFIGTATTLLRLGPFTLLTDPNFLHRGQRAYLGKGLVSRRLTEPSCRPSELPALDAVLLSHLHGDHFDRVARRELDRSVPVLTTPHAAGRLRHWGFREASAMTPWTSRTLTRGDDTLTVTSTPGVHAPRPARGLLPPVMGSVLTLEQPGYPTTRTYVTGDTLYRPWLRDVTDQCGAIDTMVIHLGGTRVLGLLVTMDADQGAALVDLLRPRVTVPVHHDDYTVFRSPLADFERRWVDRGLPGELRVVRRGDQVPLHGPA